MFLDPNFKYLIYCNELYILSYQSMFEEVECKQDEFHFILVKFIL